MSRNHLKRFELLWKRESSNENALFVDISFDSLHFPLENLHAFTNVEKNPASKKNGQSLTFRNDGNVAFAENNWHRSIEFYNRSLCFAELESENMGIAYANRSACFFNLKMYNKCLVDIDMAMAAHYPERLTTKLIKRKSDCLAMIEAGFEFVPLVPILSFQQNEMFPSIANILQIQCNKKFRRHINTTVDINVGETILIETAYVKKVITATYLRCSICYRYESNLVPCKTCTTDMFCYDGCQHNSFHNIECYFKTMHMFENVCLVQLPIVRSILMAIKTIPNVEELITFVEKTIASDPLEIPDSEPVDDKSKYRTFLKLWVNSKMETDMFKWRVYFIHKTLLNHSDIQAMFISAKHQRFLMHLIGHHISIMDYNSRPSMQVISSTYVSELQITKGEQLFISYFGRDLERDSESRRHHFDKYFDFICQCERCISNFSFIPFVNTYDLKLFQSVFTNYYDQNFNFANHAKVKYFMNKCAGYLRVNGRKPWTDEVSMIMNFFIHLLDFKLKYQLTL